MGTTTTSFVSKIEVPAAQTETVSTGVQIAEAGWSVPATKGVSRWWCNPT